MTIDTHSINTIIVLALVLLAGFIGWRASVWIGRALFICWRLGVALAFGGLFLYCYIELQPWIQHAVDSGQIVIPELVSRGVVVR